MKRRKVPNTIAEEVEFANEFIKKGGESEGKVANDTTSVAQSTLE